jgi:hypothetical protein
MFATFSSLYLGLREKQLKHELTGSIIPTTAAFFYSYYLVDVPPVPLPVALLLPPPNDHNFFNIK